MKDFMFFSPTKFFFRKGVCSEVGERLKEAGFTKAMVVYGRGSAVRNGTVASVGESLALAGVDACELGGVRPNPEVTLARQGIEIARQESPDVILAVGGGSAIDCAKAIAVGAGYEGDVWDFYAKKASVDADKVLPVAVVLTIPAAGSEASNSSVISNDELQRKCGLSSDAIRPIMAFMDPELTMTLSPYQTAAGATDMIAHILERWFSGVGDVEVTDGIAASLVKTIIEQTTKAYNDPACYDARANLMWCSTLAHNDLAGLGRSLKYGGRAGGWESHALEHELSAHDARVTHGAGLAVIMPAWMRYVWKEDPSRFLKLGKLVFDIEPLQADDPGYIDEETAVSDAVESIIAELQSAFQSWGMPTKLSDFDMDSSVIDSLLETLEVNKGSVFGAFKPLTMEDARNIYLSAL